MQLFPRNNSVCASACSVLFLCQCDTASAITAFHPHTVSHSHIHTPMAHLCCLYKNLIALLCFEPMAAQEGHIPCNFKGSWIFPGLILILVALYYNVGQLHIYDTEGKCLRCKLEMTVPAVIRKTPCCLRWVVKQENRLKNPLYLIETEHFVSQLKNNTKP